MSDPTTGQPTGQPTVSGFEDWIEKGSLPASLPLRCPYCGRGEIRPILEHPTGYGYSEHRDWTGTECDCCLAEWDTDGNPRKGPHPATLSQALQRGDA